MNTLRRGLLYVCTSLAVIAAFALAAKAQVAATGGRWIEVEMRSGVLANALPSEEVVWQEVVALHPTTPWMRLFFDEIELAPGSSVRLTSLKDGDVQYLSELHLKQWQNSSAYFNGHAVIVEVLAAPESTRNSLRVSKVWAGDPAGFPVQAPETICGSTDDRNPSSDARVGRMLTAGLGSGCTGWIINAPTVGLDRCHLTAGHCIDGDLTVLQFNVPASNANCALVHPSAANQYAINTTTWQFRNNGVGDDYGVFRCFPNSNTGLTTFQAQGGAFNLATSMPSNGAELRNTGYGVDGTSTNNAAGANGSCTSCFSPDGARNQVQQTLIGLQQSISGTSYFHQIDTCGGNSGSPVLLESSGAAVAIHTHGGCINPTGSSGNAGTRITAPALQAAIAALAGTGVALPNDECADAIEVFNGLNDSVSTLGASTSEPAWPCADGGNDLWYFYEATCTGTLVASTCEGSDFDTALQAFRGSCGALNSVACNDDVCGTRSSISFAVERGEIIRFRVGGFSGAMGEFQLQLICERTETSYDAVWKIASKPSRETGLAKIKVEDEFPFTVFTNGNLIGGPIQEGTWGLDSAGKVQAELGLADLQRIVDLLYGVGIVSLVSVEKEKYKLKEKFGRNGKPGKVQFSFQVRALLNGGGTMDLKLKLAGPEGD